MSASWSDQHRASGTPIFRVRFASRDCEPCPLQSRCTTAANGKWGRQLTLLPREQQQVLEQRRAEQQTTQWKARYDVRAGVEETVSQAVRHTGIRRTRCTGLPKTHMVRKHGRVVRLVHPAHTTMDCASCGARTKHALPLSERTYTRTACGAVSPRDKNSARVMLVRAGLNPAGAEGVRPPGAPLQEAA
ncbi:transposase [Streptomyces sp. HC307]|uniref:transposase n=1 Tax=Streptomyces flavusporus TaxID=3385496 RepID=UPI003916FD20